MLKRAVCFAAAMIIALFLASYPAFAVEYEDLPPEIREYVDEVKSSAYEEGREDEGEAPLHVTLIHLACAGDKRAAEGQKSVFQHNDLLVL